MDDNIIITSHAFQRAKERLSLNQTAFARLAVSSYKNGLRHSEVKGKLRKYCDKIWNEHKIANNIRIYGENIFIFINKNLVTVYQLPTDLRKHAKYCKNKKNDKGIKAHK